MMHVDLFKATIKRHTKSQSFNVDAVALTQTDLEFQLV